MISKDVSEILDFKVQSINRERLEPQSHNWAKRNTVWEQSDHIIGQKVSTFWCKILLVLWINLIARICGFSYINKKSLFAKNSFKVGRSFVSDSQSRVINLLSNLMKNILKLRRIKSRNKKIDKKCCKKHFKICLLLMAYGKRNNTKFSLTKFNSSFSTSIL